MKKGLKKLLSVLLVLALSVSMLTACGGGNEEEGKNDASPTGTNSGDDENAGDVNEATPTPEEVAMDLGGMEIIVGDWWSPQEAPEPKNQKEEDTLAFRNDFMEKYNFKIKQIATADYGAQQELFSTSVMAGSPAAHIFILEQAWTSQFLQNGLLYDLATLKNIDLTEEKWNQNTVELMRYGNSVYGLSVGRSEPRNGVFWNKRLFQEAGLDPDLPYDLQASGEWTLDKFLELCKTLTRDTNNDGTIDTYASCSFVDEVERGVLTAFGTRYMGRDDNGKFYNEMTSPAFLEGAQWVTDFYKSGYVMPAPEGGEANWWVQAFIDAKVAITWAEQFKCDWFKDMADDFGFVCLPKKDADSPYRAYFRDNIVVMPSSFDAETAEKIAFAYNLFTNPTPGYEDDSEAWKEDYYPKFRDERAVDESLVAMFDGSKEIVNEFLPFVYGPNRYDLLIPVYEQQSKTPIEATEELSLQWENYINDANK
jgi:ABC-type glycerol-3-phosphate transport system substrate-binding protein